MKLLDKVKNMFTEEVEEEIKPTEEVKIEQIMPEEKKENSARNTIEEFNYIKEREIKKEEKKPIFFTDDDFNDLDTYFKKEEPKKEEKVVESRKVVQASRKKEEPKLYSSNYTPNKAATEYLEKYNELNNNDNKEPYQGNTPEVKKAPKFKPTPIISPVYGILDKNYHKEDIVDKTEVNLKKTPIKAKDGLSVDSIRDKAYGTLEDELENTLFGSNSILFSDKNNKRNSENSKEEEKDFFDDLEDTEEYKEDSNLRDLENITMDIGKELDTLLNKDKKETKKDKLDFDSDDDLFNLIDTMYDGDDD